MPTLAPIRQDLIVGTGQYSAGISRASAQTKGLETQLATTGKTGNRVFGFVMVAAIGATIAAFGKALKAAVAFSRGMAEVSTLVDINVVNMKAMSDGLLEIHSNVPLALDDLTAALYQTISAGIPAAQALDFLNIAAQTAVGGVTSVATAVDGLTSIVNAFGLDARRAGEASDAMFVAMRAGKTTIGELSGALGKVAPVFAAVGLSFDEMLGSIAALTLGGLQTDIATTALRGALTSVIKPTQRASEAAHRLGIEFSAAALKSKGILAFLADIQVKTGGSVVEIAKLFENVRGMIGVLALAGKQAGKFAIIMEQMKLKAGSTALAFTKMMNEASATADVLENKLGAAFVKLGTKMLPAYNRMLKAAVGIMEEFESPAARMVALLESVGADRELILDWKVKLQVDNLRDFRQGIGDELENATIRFSPKATKKTFLESGGDLAAILFDPNLGDISLNPLTAFGAKLEEINEFLKDYNITAQEFQIKSMDNGNVIQFRQWLRRLREEFVDLISVTGTAVLSAKELGDDETVMLLEAEAQVLKDNVKALDLYTANLQAQIDMRDISADTIREQLELEAALAEAMENTTEVVEGLTEAQRDGLKDLAEIRKEVELYAAANDEVTEALQNRNAAEESLLALQALQLLFGDDVNISEDVEIARERLELQLDMLDAARENAEIDRQRAESNRRWNKAAKEVGTELVKMRTLSLDFVNAMQEFERAMKKSQQEASHMGASFDQAHAAIKAMATALFQMGVQGFATDLLGAADIFMSNLKLFQSSSVTTIGQIASSFGMIGAGISAGITIGGALGLFGGGARAEAEAQRLAESRKKQVEAMDRLRETFERAQRAFLEAAKALIGDTIVGEDTTAGATRKALLLGRNLGTLRDPKLIKALQDLGLTPELFKSIVQGDGVFTDLQDFGLDQSQIDELFRTFGGQEKILENLDLPTGQEIIEAFEALPGFEDFGEQVRQYMDETGATTLEALQALINEDVLRELQRALDAGIGSSARTFEGAARDLDLASQFLGESNEQLYLRLLSFLGEVDLPKAIQDLINELPGDLSDPNARQAIQAIIEQIIQAILLGEDLGLSAADMELLAGLLMPFGVDGVVDQITRSQQIAQSITEITANEVVALLETIEFRIRQLIDIAKNGSVAAPTYLTINISGAGDPDAVARAVADEWQVRTRNAEVGL